MTKRTLVTLLVITLSFATGGLDTHTALVSGPMVMAATPTDVREKIAPSVWNNTEGGRTMSFLVVLSSKADTRDAAGLRTKAEKGRYVYETKSRLAQATQAPLVSYLKSRGIAFRSFFIVNMLLVTGDRALVLELARRPDVERVVGNPTVRVALPTSDEAQAGQGPDSLQAIEWGILNTNAPSVWELGYDGTGIVIGGEDTGYRWTHTQLRGKYRGWDGKNADHNYNWHDAIHDSVGNPCGNDSPEPCDDNNHGSHTMGTMVGGDGPGPDPNDIGMAYGAKWIGCRNMDQGFGTPARYIECHEFMLAPTDLNGENPDPSLAPHVVNNSRGCPSSEGCDPDTLRESIEALADAGIVYVASAGNSGPVCFTVQDPPAIYQASWSVGAFNISNVLAGFSSRGPVIVDGSDRLKPDICGPGVNVRSTLRIDDDVYGTLSGTSMSGPHVVGAVALFLNVWPDLIGNVAQIRSVFEVTANPDITVSPPQTCGGTSSDEIPNNSFGWGRVDVLAAVNGCCSPGR